MRRFEIVIVGGGPAGSSTALHLVRACGVDPQSIVVLDKQKHPRDKPCGGAVSAWGLEALAKLRLRDVSRSRPMLGLSLVEGSERGTTRGNLGVIVRRDEFDAALLDAARSDGVDVRDGEGLVSLAREGNGWTLGTTRETLAARVVCACDGAGSTVRKLLGLHEPARKGHLYVTDTPPMKADGPVMSGLCEFDFTPVRHHVDGYYWDFPTPAPAGGDDIWINRGVYHANLHAASGREVKSSLARSLAERGVSINDVTLRPFSTRPLVNESVFVHEGVLLVGEAAGIDRSTGEGIAQAILYGEIAARHASRVDAYGYDREVRASRVVRHLRQSAWLARHVYAPHGRAFRKLLLRSDHARDAGIRWYRGDALGPRAKAALFGRLLLEGLRA